MRRFQPLFLLLIIISCLIYAIPSWGETSNNFTRSFNYSVLSPRSADEEDKQFNFDLSAEDKYSDQFLFSLLFLPELPFPETATEISGGEEAQTTATAVSDKSEKSEPDSPAEKTAEEKNGGDTSQETGQDIFFQDEGVVAADLPGESELNVSGRKYIGGNLEYIDYVNDPEEEGRSDLSIDQRLQVQVDGSVADDLLEIEIDYDDSRPKVDRQQTKVRYNGRKRDLGVAKMQAGAEFGDVNLSLPGTQFVSYNKQVFGLTGQIDFWDINLFGYGPEEVRVYGVASQEKGQTQREVFEGYNQRRVPDPVADINPIRRTYYQPLADSNPEGLNVEVGSEVIYLDDQNQETIDGNTRRDMVVENSGDTYVGDFNVLQAGEDYSINYRTGVIRFRRQINRNYVIAVELSARDGNDNLIELGSNRPFMIRDETESDSYERYHLENRYRLSGGNIVRDDPDRILEIRDSGDNNRPGGSNSTYNEILNLDEDGDGEIEEKYIDFDRGELKFPDTRPFTSPALEQTGAETNPTVYGPDAEREEVYHIYQEILVEQLEYFLDANVVRHSENITVDGKTMTRDEDYMIDYQTGFLTFFDRVEIDEDSRIEVEYESMGFAATRDETFLGGRVEADMTENLEMGATVLSNQESEPGDLPQLGEEAQSTLVNEFDVSWTPLHSYQDIMAGWLGKDYYSNRPLDKHLQVELDGEWAESTRNPNLSGKAIIDDFYGLDRQVPFSKKHLSWDPADAPVQFPGDSSELDTRSAVEFEEVEDEGHEPDPESEDDQESMRVNFPMDNYDYQPHHPSGTNTADSKSWGAAQYQFSSSGEDLRGYQYISLWVKWEDSAGEGDLSVDLGRLTENTDRRSDYPRTEDKKGNDVLSPGEDVGYRSHDFIFGNNNGVLDSEDLNENDRLDERERYLHFEDINKSDRVDSQSTDHGWTLYRIPLYEDKFGTGIENTDRQGQASDTDVPVDEILKDASNVRLIYESNEGAGSSAKSFLLDQMGVVRTAWNRGSDNPRPAFKLKMVSSAEENRLPTPRTSEFYDSDRRPLDKALEVGVPDTAPPGDSTTYRTYLRYPSAVRINEHKKLNFYLNDGEWSTGSSDTLYFRIGGDEDNYIQYTMPLKISKFTNGGDYSDRFVRIVDLGDDWYVVKMDLEAVENALIEKELETTGDTYRDGGFFIRGNPSLNDIQRFEYRFDLGENLNSRELLINNLHLAQAREESGQARQLDYWPG
ncbi:MAG: hypothetical protein ACQEP7_05160 [bacterium]